MREDVAVYGNYQIIVHTNLLRRIFKVSIDGSTALPARREKKMHLGETAARESC